MKLSYSLILSFLFPVRYFEELSFFSLKICYLWLHSSKKLLYLTAFWIKTIFIVFLLLNLKSIYQYPEAELQDLTPNLK